MKEIMITSGAYGHRDVGSPFVHIVSKGETCIVSDEEAERLENIGVAKILCTNIEEAEYSEVASEEAPEEFDITTLNFNQLKAIAKDMGIKDISKLNSKQKLIDAITALAEEEPELTAERLVE